MRGRSSGSLSDLTNPRTSLTWHALYRLSVIHRTSPGRGGGGPAPTNIDLLACSDDEVGDDFLGRDRAAIIRETPRDAPAQDDLDLPTTRAADGERVPAVEVCSKRKVLPGKRADVLHAVGWIPVDEQT